MTLWENNHVQFARLLAEIVATQEKLDIDALCASMDLTPGELDELFERAQASWEEHKDTPPVLAPVSPDHYRVREGDAVVCLEIPEPDFAPEPRGAYYVVVEVDLSTRVMRCGIWRNIDDEHPTATCSYEIEDY